MPLKSFLVDFI